MACLRMRYSELGQHLFDMNIIPADYTCDYGLSETASHFFYDFALYIVPRGILYELFLRHNFDFTFHVL